MSNSYFESNSKRIYSQALKLALVALLIAVAVGGGQTARAQGGALEWSEPVNLSRSGAAEQPRIVAAPDGRQQAFWWDRFDGLMTSVFNGSTWSVPVAANIASTALTSTPDIYLDKANQIHAFWLSAGVGGPLQQSQMFFGSTVWSLPIVVADSVVDYDLEVGEEGSLTLAYVRSIHVEGLQAGVYVRRMSGLEGWQQAVPVYTTIYFRLLTKENAEVRLAEVDGRLYLVWEDPRLEQVYYSESGNLGISWTAPEVLGDAEEAETRPRILPANPGVIRQWETRLFSGCALVQEVLIGSEWSVPVRVWDDLAACPTGEQYWALSTGLVASWGQGSGALTLRGWDAGSLTWSAPINLSFQFEDQEMGTFVNLIELRAFLTDGAIAVVGSDPSSGEVWATRAETNTLEFTIGGPPPWLFPEVVAEGEQEIGASDVAIDNDGRMHVVWSQAQNPREPQTSLGYSRFDGTGWTGAVEVIVGSVEEGLTREPTLLADQGGLIHLAWSGGNQGQIYYARAVASQANVPSAWSIPGLVSQGEFTGGSPELGVDASGGLYLLYVVPVNDGRGVYLVKSENGGESWSEPVRVFDAEAAEWQQVNHARLAVSPNGVLYAVWVQAAAFAEGTPLGIYHSYSEDGGATWATARELVGMGFDWPQIAASNEQVHVLYEDVGGVSAWHRWANAVGQPGGELNWSLTASVQGMQDMLAPLGLVADGTGAFHLVGVNPDEAQLLYTMWNGSRWGAVERVLLDPTVTLTGGPSLTTLPQGGQLAVTFLGGESGAETAQTKVLFTMRGIAAADIEAPTGDGTAEAAPTDLATEAATAEATATAVPLPQFSGQPLDTSGLPLPLILSGVAAIVIVGGGLAWYYLRERRR